MLSDDFEARIVEATSGSPQRYQDLDYYFTITDVQVKSSKDWLGRELPRRVAVISAEFVLRDDLCLVIVKNGLDGVSRHFYPYGETAIAISKDVEKVRGALTETIDTLTSWEDDEKAELKDEVLYSSTSLKFNHW